MMAKSYVQCDEGARSSRLVVHLGPHTSGQEVQERVVSLYQVVSGKVLKLSQKTVTGTSKKKVSFRPLEESFKHSDKYVSCIIEENLVELRSRYYIPKTMKLRAPTADKRPHHVYGGEVTIYLEVICVSLCFPIHPFFQRVLHSLHVAPIQLNPNSIGFYQRSTFSIINLVWVSFLF